MSPGAALGSGEREGYEYNRDGQPLIPLVPSGRSTHSLSDARATRAPTLRRRCTMAANDHQTYIYVGLAGEGQFVGDGGLYRYAVGDGTWQSITQGLPPAPQVRALLIRPDNPAVVYAGTQYGPYRSDDRGDHWEPLDTPREGRDVWSLACHPEHPDVLYAG